ncbi:MAG: hypothetical protein EA383_14825 [Spirochaetaceae bacterium]|nr:MAG: hypothetical protein EA383_14825 [Spirochaetaceae bacterium]
MAVDNNTNPRVRVTAPLPVLICVVLFIPLQVFIVLSHPALLAPSALLLLVVIAIQRVPLRTLARILLPVLLPAFITGIARATETAETLNLPLSVATLVTVLRFLVLVASAYLLVRSCAIQDVLIRSATRTPPRLQAILFSAWFVLALIPETTRVVHNIRTAVLFRPGISPVQRLRAISTAVLQRVLTSGHNRAAAVALRLSEENSGDSPR